MRNPLYLRVITLALVLSVALITCSGFACTQTEASSHTTQEQVEALLAHDDPDAASTPQSTTVSPTPTPTAATTNISTVTPIVTSYILNTDSFKIHMLDCHYVDMMIEENKQLTRNSLATLHSQGYVDCLVCCPH